MLCVFSVIGNNRESHGSSIIYKRFFFMCKIEKKKNKNNNKNEEVNFVRC